MHFSAAQNITPSGSKALQQRTVMSSLLGFSGELDRLIAR